MIHVGGVLLLPAAGSLIGRMRFNCVALKSLCTSVDLTLNYSWMINTSAAETSFVINSCWEWVSMQRCEKKWKWNTDLSIIRSDTHTVFCSRLTLCDSFSLSCKLKTPLKTLPQSLQCQSMHDFLILFHFVQINLWLTLQEACGCSLHNLVIKKEHCTFNTMWAVVKERFTSLTDSQRKQSAGIKPSAPWNWRISVLLLYCVCVVTFLKVCSVCWGREKLKPLLELLCWESDRLFQRYKKRLRENKDHKEATWSFCGALTFSSLLCQSRPSKGTDKMSRVREYLY